MTDYRLSKLFYDLHNDPKLAAEYRADMPGFLHRYDISPEMREAVLSDDVGKIAPHVNAYLLRFYFRCAECRNPSSWRGSTRSAARASSRRKRPRMAELVGVFAASHGPIIARDWEIMPADIARN